MRTQLPSGNRPYDQKGLRAQSDSLRQWRVGRLMGQVFFTCEEPEQRPALLCDMITDCPAQHWVTRLQRIEDRALRHGAFHIERYLSINPGQVSQMIRQHYPDHGNV